MKCITNKGEQVRRVPDITAERLVKRMEYTYIPKWVYHFMEEGCTERVMRKRGIL